MIIKSLDSFSQLQTDVKVTLKLKRVSWMDGKLALMPVMGILQNHEICSYVAKQ